MLGLPQFPYPNYSYVFAKNVVMSEENALDN